MVCLDLAGARLGRDGKGEGERPLQEEGKHCRLLGDWPPGLELPQSLSPPRPSHQARALLVPPAQTSQYGNAHSGCWDSHVTAKHHNHLELDFYHPFCSLTLWAYLYHI